MSPERRFETLEDLIQHWRAPEPSPDFVERTMQRLEAPESADDTPLPGEPGRPVGRPATGATPSARRTLQVPLSAVIAGAVVIVASLAGNLWSWWALREETREKSRAEREEAPAESSPDLYALHEPLPETAGTVILLPVVPGARCELETAPSSEAERIRRSRAW